MAGGRKALDRVAQGIRAEWCIATVGGGVSRQVGAHGEGLTRIMNLRLYSLGHKSN